MSDESATNNTESIDTRVSSTENVAGVSAAQLAANRENAQKSTGPKTLVGKIRSSRNALKHSRYCGQSTLYTRALYSRMQELGEDPADFAEIEDGLRNSFLPSNTAENMLVHDLALLEWQRRRLERGEAALLARRIQKLEIEREREIMKVNQKINSQIPTTQLTFGLLWQQEESPTKYQKLLEWLETLQGFIQVREYKNAEAVVEWIYGKVPTVRGAYIRQLFRILAEAGSKESKDADTISTLRLELEREIANITAQYRLYLREHTELTPTMREECLAPTRKQCAVLSQINMIDRRIDQRFRLLLTLKKVAAEHKVQEAALSSWADWQDHPAHAHRDHTGHKAASSKGGGTAVVGKVRRVRQRAKKITGGDS